MTYKDLPHIEKTKKSKNGINYYLTVFDSDNGKFGFITRDQGEHSAELFDIGLYPIEEALAKFKKFGR